MSVSGILLLKEEQREYLQSLVIVYLTAGENQSNSLIVCFCIVLLLNNSKGLCHHETRLKDGSSYLYSIKAVLWLYGSGPSTVTRKDQEV